MSTPLVQFDGVWKKFRRGERHDSLRDLIPATFGRLFRRQRHDELGAQEFWAVQDVSFEVRPGEALGIIGPNGAGKSTTLKLLTKILRPTRGVSRVQGRVGALIEVAAGFHPDLTGRENVFLQGAIMGMKRRDIQRRLDQIIEFAGVSQFIDTQVKRYSSGMNARLGFSIAAHLDPDVLIIDEVLSVGDAAYQEKCVERMLAFRRDGVPVVFVSHNLQSVLLLCDRAMHLEGGVRHFGPTADVLKSYVTSSRKSIRSVDQGAVSIVGAELLGSDDVARLQPGTPLALEVSYVVREDISDLSFGFLMHRSTDMLVVYDGNFSLAEVGLGSLRAGQRFTLRFGFNVNVTRGHYFLDTHVYHNPTQTFVSRLSPAANITVHEMRTFAGVSDLAVSAASVQA